MFIPESRVLKKLEIQKTQPTICISVLKVNMTIVGLVFLISYLFIDKTA